MGTTARRRWWGPARGSRSPPADWWPGRERGDGQEEFRRGGSDLREPLDGPAPVPQAKVPEVLLDPSAWRDRSDYNRALTSWAIRQGLTGDRPGTVHLVALEALGLRR